MTIDAAVANIFSLCVLGFFAWFLSPLTRIQYRDDP